MMNWFAVDPCDCAPGLPALAADPLCYVIPRFSQVIGLIMLPLGAARAVDWTDYDSFSAILDNTSTDNSKGKFFLGRGELLEPQDIIVSLGRSVRRIIRRRYDLVLSVEIQSDQQYAMMRHVQKSYRAFRFWVPTLGGRILGGADGIRPSFVSARGVYQPGINDTEAGKIILQWYSDIDPDRADMSELFETTTACYGAGGAGGACSGGASVAAFYAQDFPAQETPTLVWTENSGSLPSTNTAAQVIVTMAGQKIYESLGQYTINHATGPGESEIVISGSTHIEGANYQVITLTTS